MSKKVGAIKDVNPNLVLIVGGVFASYFFIIKPILEALNLKKTKAEEEAEKKEKEAIDKAEKSSENTPWASTLYKNCLSGKIGKGKALYYKNYASSISLCKTIYKSIGRSLTSPDNEIAIEGVFKQCTSQLMVSQLVTQYYTMYKLDLYQDIKNVLYTEETGTNIFLSWTPAKQREAFNRIITYVDNLPLITYK